MPVPWAAPHATLLTGELLIPMRPYHPAPERHAGFFQSQTSAQHDHLAYQAHHASDTRLLASRSTAKIITGSFQGNLRIYKVKERDFKPEDLLLTEVEYQALRPYETDEHRALMQSTFDNLMWLANKISSVKSMLGETEDAKSLTGLADEVSDMLGSLGGSAAEITKQLRNSNYTRTATKNTFNDFLQRITTQEIEVKTRSKTLRRKIKIGGNSDE